MNPYRQRILPILQQLLAERSPIGTTLDFGSGDGWFASHLLQKKCIGPLTAIDVKRRDHVFLEPQLYDGSRLPFTDRAFDLCYSVDVLHHCPDPAASLRDLARCTNRLFVLKDHTWRTRAGRYGLAILDELGNRKFGIPCLYEYQYKWDWFPVMEDAGFRLVKLIHPAVCHTGLMGKLTNALQFAALWERT